MLSHKLSAILLVVVCMLVVSVQTVDPEPPILSSAYQMAFDQTFIVKEKKYIVNGQLYYDATNNRERVDRSNGQYDLFCSAALPNITTPCTQLTVDSKRYIYFPAKRQCCFCCDSAHGCGILKPDWLSDATYQGTAKLIDTNYDKWSKDGMFGYNHMFVTTDSNHIPRRLDENGDHITDYIVGSYTKKTYASDDVIFLIPDYCIDNCPLTSICGKLRGQTIQAE